MEAQSKNLILRKTISLERLDSQVIANHVNLIINEISLQDVYDIVQIMNHNLEFLGSGGHEISRTELSEFRQLFRIHELYMAFLNEKYEEKTADN